MGSSLFANSGSPYSKSHRVFLDKSRQTEKINDLIQLRIPPLIDEKKIFKEQSLNVLSIGSGNGQADLFVLKVIKEQLMKTDLGHGVKIFNRAIDPNLYSCDLYRAAIENLPSPLNDGKVAFEICQQSFEEYQQSHREPLSFDIVHFIHSIYYVDIEKALLHCFEKEVSGKGKIICIASRRDLISSVASKLQQKLQWHVGSEIYDVVDKMIQIANKNGWKIEVHDQEYSIDVTEVFDPHSIEGNLLLDFLTQTENFRNTEDKEFVEETLSFIRDLTFVKDGKLFGEKKESLVVICK